MNTIEEFVDEVMAETKRLLHDENISIISNLVTKNNGIRLHGLSIREESSNVAPTIYLDDMFREYREGRGMEDCVNQVIAIYRSNKILPFCVDFFEDYDQVKPHILPKLINLERNHDLLLECPHMTYGNLAVIFQVVLGDDGDNRGAITVRNEHMAMWGTNVADLYTVATSNVREKNPTQIRSMFSVLSELMMFRDSADDEIISSDIINHLEDDESCGMFVMNAGKINGAVALTDIEALQKFADQRKTDLVILPSSIHEVIILTDGENTDISNLENMVHEVNATQVAPEDFLSEDVYRFNRETGVLSIASTNLEVKLAS